MSSTVWMLKVAPATFRICAPAYALISPPDQTALLRFSSVTADRLLLLPSMTIDCAAIRRPAPLISPPLQVKVLLTSASLFSVNVPPVTVKLAAVKAVVGLITTVPAVMRVIAVLLYAPLTKSVRLLPLCSNVPAPLTVRLVQA